MTNIFVSFGIILASFYSFIKCYAIVIFFEYCVIANILGAVSFRDFALINCGWVQELRFGWIFGLIGKLAVLSVLSSRWLAYVISAFGFISITLECLAGRLICVLWVTANLSSAVGLWGCTFGNSGWVQELSSGWMSGFIGSLAVLSVQSSYWLADFISAVGLFSVALECLAGRLFCVLWVTANRRSAVWIRGSFFCTFGNSGWVQELRFGWISGLIGSLAVLSVLSSIWLTDFITAVGLFSVAFTSITAVHRDLFTSRWLANSPSACSCSIITSADFFAVVKVFTSTGAKINRAVVDVSITFSGGWLRCQECLAVSKIFV